MLKKICIIGLFISVFAIFASAQDLPASAEELFYFYPVDMYNSISFSSNEFSKDEEAYRFYRWMTKQMQQAQQKAFESVRGDDDEQTLTSLFTDSRFNTRASATRTRFVEFDVPREYDVKESRSMVEELRKEFKNSIPIQTFDSEKQKMIVHGAWIYDRHTYQVYYYDDVQAALKTSVAEGSIADTGEVRHGKPVFNLSREFGEVSVSYYMWATETGELLMTDKLEDLDAMISTVYDGRASILSQSEYVDAFGMIPDLGQSWRIYFTSSNEKMSEKQIEYMTDEKLKERFKESMNTSPLYSINSRSLGDTYTSTDIEVYKNEEMASKALEQKKQMPARYRQMQSRTDIQEAYKRQMEFQIYVAENTVYRLDGRSIIGVLTYDREYVQQMKKRYENLGELWKEQKAKEEKERKEKDKEKK